MKKSDKRSRGFTIIEVMIVLAVSGFILLGAIATIGGRQSSTEFEQATQAVQSNINQSIEYVANGYYPNIANFTCTSSDAGGTPPAASPQFSAGGSSSVGGNVGCIFLGTALHFYGSTSNYASKYTSFTVAGRQCVTGIPANSDCVPLTSLTDSLPTVFENLTASPILDESQTVNLEYGLKVQSMWYCAVAPTSATNYKCLNPTQPSSTGASIGSVAFLVNPASPSGSNIISGGVTVSIYAIDNTTVPVGSSLDSPGSLPDAAQISNINAVLDSLTPPVKPVPVAVICFVSGTTNQYALLTISPGSGQLTTNLSLRSGNTCFA